MGRQVRCGHSQIGNFGVKVAVSGASGFIGEQVVASLLGAGHHVLALGREPTSAATDFRPLDLNHPNDFDFAALATADVFVHLAWGGLSDFRSITHVTEELPRHLAFFELARGQLPKHVIGIGTCLEYGLQNGCLDETALLAPSVAYAQAKHILHTQLRKSLRQQSITLNWLRPFYVYGFNKRRKTLYSLLAEAAQRGEPYFKMSRGEQISRFYQCHRNSRHYHATRQHTN